MLKKYILSLFLFFVIVVLGVVVKYRANTFYEVKTVYNSENESKKYAIEEIIEKADIYEVKIYYPLTNYEKLNEKIKNQIEEYLKNFKSAVSGYTKEELTSNLFFDITFNTYEYENYISVVLNITENVGGAHPEETVIAFNYDIKNDEIITIDNLIMKNEKILEILSNYSKQNLKNEERIKKYSNEEFLNSGTSQNKENFSNFSFTKNGLVIYFNKYQVAPYVAGTFKIEIPYDIVNL